MHKLPSLTSKEVIKILERKGFVLDRTKGSHQIYYHPESKRIESVKRHREWQKILSKDIFFDEVFADKFT